MKSLNRELTTREKVLLLVLVLILLALAYYQFVDLPARTAINKAHSERDSLSIELSAVQTKLAVMRRMRDEMEDITAGGTVSEMKSYNNSKAEIALLNDILRGTPQYSINFAEVTRDGDQVRRNFTLQFTTESFDTVVRVLRQLEQSPYRCLIGDLKISAARGGNVRFGTITVNATATFFETMVGGTADAGLPASRRAA